MTPRKTILVVDDELDILNLIAGALESHGHQVLVSQNGAEALQILDSHPTPIDLLLTDITMPGMGGVALSEKVKRNHPSIRIVYMTGSADPELIRRAQPLLLKPFEMGWLAEQLDAFLETVDDERTQS